MSNSHGVHCKLRTDPYTNSMLFDIINTYDEKTISHLKALWDDILQDLAKHEDSKKIVSFL